MSDAFAELFGKMFSFPDTIEAAEKAIKEDKHESLEVFVEAEVSAIADVLIRNGLITSKEWIKLQEEYQDIALRKHAEALCQRNQKLKEAK